MGTIVQSHLFCCTRAFQSQQYCQKTPTKSWEKGILRSSRKSGRCWTAFYEKFPCIKHAIVWKLWLAVTSYLLWEANGSWIFWETLKVATRCLVITFHKRCFKGKQVYGNFMKIEFKQGKKLFLLWYHLQGIRLTWKCSKTFAKSVLWRSIMHLEVTQSSSFSSSFQLTIRGFLTKFSGYFFLFWSS